jgi:hypothetical protein
MNILVKICDVLKSSTYKNKYAYEFIVYLMYDETPIEAYLELGGIARNNRIKDLMFLHNIKDEDVKIIYTK